MVLVKLSSRYIVNEKLNALRTDHKPQTTENEVKEMREGREDQPFFHISVVSEMLQIHPQTIRNYERKGLLEPSRTQGNMRLFSRFDVESIKRIHTYTNMGVNLAGVEIILKLLERMDQMREDMERAMSNPEEEGGEADGEAEDGEE